MKKFIITVAALAVAAVVSPKLIGGIVETEHQNIIENLNKSENIQATAKSFTRNWFGGNAVTELSVTLPDESMGDITLLVEETLSFGPVIFSDDGLDFGLSHAVAKINVAEFLLDEEVKEYLNDKIKITGLLTFSSDVETRVNIASISKEVDGNKMVSQAASGAFTIKDASQVVGQFKWGGFTLNDSTQVIEIGQFNADIDQTLISGELFSANTISIGDASFSLASIHFEDTLSQNVVDVKALGFTATASEKDDLVEANIHYRIGELSSMGQTFKNANLDLVMEKFDIKTIQALNLIAASAPDVIDDAFIEQNQAQFLALIAQLLEKDPVVKVNDLSVETADGKIHTDMEFMIDKTLFDPANYMSAMGALKVKANGNSPVAFFTNLGMEPIVNMYVEQGLILKEKETLSFAADFAQGQLTVNGNVIPM